MIKLLRNYYYTLLLLIIGSYSSLQSQQSTSSGVYTIFSENEHSNMHKKNSELDELKKAIAKKYSICNANKSRIAAIKKHPKSLLQTLSEDFDNTDFLAVKTFNFFSIYPSEKASLSDDLCVNVEEWIFDKKAQALSVFKSLQTYKERAIHFISINWIWAYQGKKIYLISSLNHPVPSEEMQYIKNQLNKILEKKGTYNTFSFYE